MISESTATNHTDEPALLVTGAAGRTGGYAARLLLERGHRVRALVHSFDDRAANLRDSGAEVIVGDLQDIDSGARHLRHRVLHADPAPNASAADERSQRRAERAGEAT